MKNLRTSLTCLALLASAAACSDANPLTAPGAPRFDGGQHGNGQRAEPTTVTTTSGGGPLVGGNRADTTTVTTADDGGQYGTGNLTSTEDGGGMQGSGGIVTTVDDGGQHGSGDRGGQTVGSGG